MGATQVAGLLLVPVHMQAGMTPRAVDTEIAHSGSPFRNSSKQLGKILSSLRPSGLKLNREI
jgi:hypothetical protein